MEQPANQDRTDDALLGGRVRLRQPGSGYRAAIDPVLLAAAVPAGPGMRVLDVGCGAGAAALSLAARVPEAEITGLEVRPELARLARENVALNGVRDRVRVVEGDLSRPPPDLIPASFHQVMANPPFQEAGSGNAPPAADKAQATVEGRARLEDWVDFCVAMARPKGGVTLIHRADRLDAVLAAFRARAVGALVVFPLWPGRRGRPAKRVIVAGRKGLATPLRLHPGLVLHEKAGGYTAEAEAILRDAASIDAVAVAG